MNDLKNLQRYRTKRPNHSGRDRWYWQRPGHPLTRLPDDLVEQMAMLRQLNATADAARQTDQTRAPERYSIGWMIAEYRREDYPRLSANSKKITKITPAGADLPRLLREGQSVSVLREGRLAGIVVPLPHLIGADPVALSISCAAPKAC